MLTEAKLINARPYSEYTSALEDEVLLLRAQVASLKAQVERWRAYHRDIGALIAEAMPHVIALAGVASTNDGQGG